MAARNGEIGLRVVRVDHNLIDEEDEEEAPIAPPVPVPACGA